jgi:hypothetical protein
VFSCQTSLEIVVLAFDRAVGKTAYNITLHKNENKNYRKNSDNSESHSGIPEGLILLHIIINA